jgi:hypothetical protein
MATTRTGNCVLLLSQLADDLLQVAAIKPFATDKWSEYGQAKQGLRVDVLHAHSYG